MKNIFPISRLSVMVCLLMVFFLTTCNREGTHVKAPVIFPFFNKIYMHQSANPSPEIIHESQYFFTKYFYQSGYTCWVSGSLRNSNKKELFVFDGKNNKIKTVLSGNFSQIIPVNNMAITISGEFSPGKGFRYDFYRISNNLFQNKILYSIYLDLFLSDIEEFSNNILILGSDQQNTNHAVYTVDPGAKKNQLLFTVPKKRDFLKLIQTDDTLTFYRSLQDWEEEQNFYLRHYRKKDPESLGSIGPPLEIDVSTALKDYVPFGKGFGDLKSLYVPVINKSYDCGLLKLSNLDTIVTNDFYPMATSLYLSVPSSLTTDPDHYYFVGYNYYKEQNKFYFLRFSKEFSGDSFKDVEYPELTY